MIETPLFWLAGYKNLVDCLHFTWINIVSNIMLNQSLYVLDIPAHSWRLYVAVIIGEVLVVILEFAMSRCIMKSIGKFSLMRLLITILFTNASSFALGLIFMMLH